MVSTRHEGTSGSNPDAGPRFRIDVGPVLAGRLTALERTVREIQADNRRLWRERDANPSAQAVIEAAHAEIGRLIVDIENDNLPSPDDVVGALLGIGRALQEHLDLRLSYVNPPTETPEEP